MSRTLAGFCIVVLLALGACSSDNKQEAYRNPKVDPAPDTGNGSMFGSLFGSSAKSSETTQPGIAVNSFLWRASLDTLSFMPLASADPFGGVIITDWYSPPETPNERFKVNIFILDRVLRSDALRAAVFHQRRQGNSDWADVATDSNTQTDLENAILTRARQLRISSAGVK
ncbi:MAG: hypothetical protein JWL84_2509 [Rhodospirillales bacterium]|jgi:hypothetical protein|nr:hypothetical protein [Rhodospirillales bacterium]